jgi:hypothetical protein
MLKRLRRIWFEIWNKQKPQCDICNEVNSPEEGCARFKTQTDEKDWKAGLYPEACKYY